MNPSTTSFLVVVQKSFLLLFEQREVKGFVRACLRRGAGFSASRSSRLYSGGGAGEEKKIVKRPERVLSGVQPTGSLHLGNYLGAIRQWVKIQDEYDSVFTVVDLHALTVPQNPKELAQNSLSAVATYVAAGVDPDKSPIFIQSHVSAHAELTWLLNCMTPVNWLERMIQYKEKALKQGENVGVGLFDYPVLMAADILLYQASLVPVGEDQRQHLELTRDIQRRFHDMYCKKKKKRVFREPKALIVPEGARVMSLTDGTSKMSKSAELDNSRINLLDSPDVIRSKIKKCKTDSERGMVFDDPNRPECNNLLGIYAAVTGLEKSVVADECADLSWGEFKPKLTDAVVAHLEPIQTKYHQTMADEASLNEIVKQGKERAEEIATQTLDSVKDAIGLAPLPR